MLSQIQGKDKLIADLKELHNSRDQDQEKSSKKEHSFEQEIFDLKIQLREANQLVKDKDNKLDVELMKAKLDNESLQGDIDR